jgi:Type III restriction enzyme, res subunit/Hom_end-associated Hint
VVILRLSNYLEIENPPANLEKWLAGFCVFQTNNYSNEDTPPVLNLFQKDDNIICVPRGLLEEVENKLKNSNTAYTFEDHTTKPQKFDFKIKPEIQYKEGLFSFQKRAVDGLKKFHTVRLEAPCGCHAKDTPILMYNGDIKLVQEVVVGDLVMGPNSNPRKVLKLHRGSENLYKISPIKGTPFVVNENHILHLVRLNSKKYTTNTRLAQKKSGCKVNISIKDYLNTSKTFKEIHKLYKVGIDFPTTDTLLPIEPYFLGLLLGDGSFRSRKVKLTTADREVGLELLNFALKNLLRLTPTIHKNNKSIDYALVTPRGQPNHLLNAIRSLGLGEASSGDKFIPQTYKVASKENRLKILAGLLDTDGHLCNNGFDYITKSTQLGKDVAFIARSLGFLVNEGIKTIIYKGSPRSYHRLTISGKTEEIPVKIKRKQALPRKQIKINTRSGFKVEPIGIGDYYGFELDQDHLYLTGDFFVHHNSGKTSMACLLAGELNEGPVLFLVNKDKLLRQFIATATKILGIPKEDIGIIKAQKYKIKPITVGSLQTMGKETFDLDAIKTTFNMVFFDECHISTAITYRRVLLGLAPQRLIGLSATPEHYFSEDLNRLMTALLGPVGVIIHESEIPNKLTPETYTIETGRTFTFKAGPNSPEWMKHKCRDLLFKAIAEDRERNKLVFNTCRQLLQQGHKLIITVARINHAKLLYDGFVKCGIPVSFPYKLKKDGLYAVDHKKLDEDCLRVSEGELEGIVGTYSLLQTGFDCPELSAVVLAAPFSGINSTTMKQTAGRVNRRTFNKTSTILVDFIEDIYVCHWIPEDKDRGIPAKPYNILRTWGEDREEVLKEISHYNHTRLEKP